MNNTTSTHNAVVQSSEMLGTFEKVSFCPRPQHHLKKFSAKTCHMTHHISLVSWTFGHDHLVTLSTIPVNVPDIESFVNVHIFLVLTISADRLNAFYFTRLLFLILENTNTSQKVRSWD